MAGRMVALGGRAEVGEAYAERAGAGGGWGSRGKGGLPEALRAAARVGVARAAAARVAARVEVARVGAAMEEAVLGSGSAAEAGPKWAGMAVARAAAAAVQVAAWWAAEAVTASVAEWAAAARAAVWVVA